MLHVPFLLPYNRRYKTERGAKKRKCAGLPFCHEGDVHLNSPETLYLICVPNWKLFTINKTPQKIRYRYDRSYTYDTTKMMLLRLFPTQPPIRRFSISMRGEDSSIWSGCMFQHTAVCPLCCLLSVVGEPAQNMVCILRCFDIPGVGVLFIRLCRKRW